MIYALLIPLIISLYLSLISSNTNSKDNSRSYILGYNGPIDLGEYSHNRPSFTQQSLRIEPVFLSDNLIHNLNHKQEHHRQNINTSIREEPLTTSSTLPVNNFFNNKKNYIFILLAVLCIFIAATFFLSISTTQNNQPTITEKAPPTRLSRVDFPGQFSLMLSEYKGLIIHWQSDNTDNNEVWSIHSAQGEKLCQNIIFDHDKKIRTTTVTIEANNYFANFSPLDTVALIQAIALKKSFSLCGVSFSLKGSHALLGKHVDYAELIQY